MSRWILSITWVVILSAAHAQAIEMFTNVHNGENIGLPPMEVPIRMYPGFGRGGWAPGVIGAPLKTMPPVPSMYPTGPAPVLNRGNRPSFQTGMSVTPQSDMLLARNGRRQRFNGRMVPQLESRSTTKAQLSAPAEVESPRGLTVLKPQLGTPPELGDRPIATQTPDAAADVRSEGIDSDANASAFFQNAISGW